METIKAWKNAHDLRDFFKVTHNAYKGSIVLPPKISINITPENVYAVLLPVI